MHGRGDMLERIIQKHSNRKEPKPKIFINSDTHNTNNRNDQSNINHPIQERISLFKQQQQQRNRKQSVQEVMTGYQESTPPPVLKLHDSILTKSLQKSNNQSIYEYLIGAKNAKPLFENFKISPLITKRYMVIQQDNSNDMSFPDKYNARRPSTCQEQYQGKPKEKKRRMLIEKLNISLEEKPSQHQEEDVKIIETAKLHRRSKTGMRMFKNSRKLIYVNNQSLFTTDNSAQNNTIEKQQQTQRNKKGKKKDEQEIDSKVDEVLINIQQQSMHKKNHSNKNHNILRKQANFTQRLGYEQQLKSQCQSVENKKIQQHQLINSPEQRQAKPLVNIQAKHTQRLSNINIANEDNKERFQRLMNYDFKNTFKKVEIRMEKMSKRLKKHNDIVENSSKIDMTSGQYSLSNRKSILLLDQHAGKNAFNKKVKFNINFDIVQDNQDE